MLLIGEKINGAVAAVARAVEAGDGACIQGLAERQARAGADYLDVCACVRRAREPQVLRWLVEQVQAVTDTPLCLDSAAAEVCLEAMAWCRWPGILNSVSLEGEKAPLLFPAIAGTPWQCIVLPCGERLPGTAEERLEVLARLLELAERYGVRRDQLLVDPMVQTLGLAENGLAVTLQTIRAVREQYPALRIVGAVSNCSHQMPGRRGLNQACLTMAMGAGMDCAILDPTDGALMGALRAAEAVLGRDPYCLDYLNACRADQTIGG